MEFSVISKNAESAAQELLQKAAAQMPQEVAAISNALASFAYRMWRGDAEAASAWGKRYGNTLVLEPMAAGGGEAKVFFDEGHPDALFFHMVENGVSSWSIRNALLASKKVKVSGKGVRYIVVPMRERTPGPVKKSSFFSGVLSSDVYALVRDGGAVKGERGPVGLKRYGNELHGQYRTFRVVTENTPTTAWRFPDIPPTPVFESVKARIEMLVEQTIINYVTEAISALQKTKMP